MRDEVTAAVLFLARLLEKSENFNHDQLEHFKNRLSELLLEKFENHWFPEKPDRGQGYRCIRVNGVSRRDDTLEKAANACGIKYEDMKLPCELTIWVDPNEVCCRFGENKGSFCTLASFSDKDSGSDASSSSGCEDSLSLGEESGSSDTASSSGRRGSESSEEAPPSPCPPPAISLSLSPSQPATLSVGRHHVETSPHSQSGEDGSGGNVGGNGRKGGRKSSNGGRQTQQAGQRGRAAGGRSGSGGCYPHPQHPLHPQAAWYSIISPPWLSPSPPPYSHPPAYRSKWPPASGPHHHRPSVGYPSSKQVAPVKV